MMAGPWRVRFVHHGDSVWQRLIAAGLVPADGGSYDLLKAAELDPALVMHVSGGFMPWPFFRYGGDAPGAPPLGVHVFCPQCGSPGAIHIRHDSRTTGAVWEWDGSADAPTVRPSIESVRPEGCGGHYYLTDGMLTDLGGHMPVSLPPPNPSPGGDAQMADETPTTPAAPEAPAETPAAPEAAPAPAEDTHPLVAAARTLREESEKAGGVHLPHLLTFLRHFEEFARHELGL